MPLIPILIGLAALAILVRSVSTASGGANAAFNPTVAVSTPFSAGGGIVSAQTTDLGSEVDVRTSTSGGGSTGTPPTQQGINAGSEAGALALNDEARKSCIASRTWSYQYVDPTSGQQETKYVPYMGGPPGTNKPGTGVYVQNGFGGLNSIPVYVPPVKVITWIYAKSYTDDLNVDCRLISKGILSTTMYAVPNSNFTSDFIASTVSGAIPADGHLVSGGVTTEQDPG